MDWSLAIERNREALKRILAMLVAMARLAAEPHLEVLASGVPKRTLPRHLHRAILRLLRPAESAARRLIIVAARGLVVPLSPPRPTILGNGVGTGIIMPSSVLQSAPPRPRALALPLLDPLRPFRLRRSSANGIPRISLPGVTAPFPVEPRRPPASDDPLDASHLALRLKALGAALDDLPRQASRFARWRAARPRDAAGAQNKEQDAAGAQNKEQDAAGAQNKERQARRTRRIWPLRPGRPPGQQPANRRTHEVHEILNDLHGLAFDVLEHPDTS